MKLLVSEILELPVIYYITDREDVSKFIVAIEIPKDLFKIKHKFEPDDFAPGIWAGCEGLELTVTKIDLENREITLEYQEVKTI